MPLTLNVSISLPPSPSLPSSPDVVILAGHRSAPGNGKTAGRGFQTNTTSTRLCRHCFSVGLEWCVCVWWWWGACGVDADAVRHVARQGNHGITAAAPKWRRCLQTFVIGYCDPYIIAAYSQQTLNDQHFVFALAALLCPPSLPSLPHKKFYNIIFMTSGPVFPVLFFVLR